MLLELKQVGYRTATTKIVNNISFTLQRGEFKLITGPSGCGKST
ncbi:ATP-binding cassette domain-containing protein, partial [Campylobacter coli]